MQKYKSALILIHLKSFSNYKFNSFVFCGSPEKHHIFYVYSKVNTNNVLQILSLDFSVPDFLPLLGKDMTAIG